MTRSRAKKVPHDFTRVAFPVKALKMLLHDLQSDGEAATMSAFNTEFQAAEIDDSDDENEEWVEEEKLNQGFMHKEFAMLSDLIGSKDMGFDDDGILSVVDDDDLKNDQISQMDMKAHLLSFFKECAARNSNNFSAIVDQLMPEEILVVRRVLNLQPEDASTS